MSTLKLTTIALALALLGCGSSGTTSGGNFSNANSLDASARQLVIQVPPEGGSVDLPRTQNIAAKLTFAAGAAPGTLLTLAVSENGPAGTEADTPTGNVQRDGFYYILFNTNKPFDLALLQSVVLTEASDPGVKARAISDQAEVYQAELGEYTGGSATFGQAVEGYYDTNTGSSVFHQIDPLVMQPGRPQLFQAKSIDTETMTVTVTNNSGVEPAYLCVLGQNPNPANKNEPDPNFYRVSADGKMVPFSKDDRTIGKTTDPNGYVDGYTELYNIPLASGTSTLTLPQMRAGRMYVSLGRKMQIRLEDYRPPAPPALTPLSYPSVLLAQPNGWTNPGDPNYQTLFDWMEFDYKVNNTGSGDRPGIGINKTEVDMMGFGVQFEVNGPTVGNSTTNPPAPVLGTTTDGRKLIFDALEADSFFRRLIVPGPAKGKRDNGEEFDIPVPLRCIAPVKGLENSFYNRPEPQYRGFDLTYFDDYLTRVWERYKTEDLKCYTSAFGIWYGRVDGNDKMVFTCVTDQGVPRPGFDKIYLRKPSTTNAFEPTEWITSGGITYQPDAPNGPFVPVPQPGPSDTTDPAIPRSYTKFAATEIVSAMSAAMNRTTLLHEPLLTRDYVNHPHDKLNFYKKDAETNRINVYAKTIHDHSLILRPDAPGLPTSNGGGAAYAFGFDDNSNQSSYISELNHPTALKITITPLGP